MALSAVALCLFVCPVFAYEFHYDTTYVLRWGRQEGDADLVRCLHGQMVGYSMGVGCYKKGSYITLSLVLGDDPMDAYIVDWYFVYADLYQVLRIDDNGNLVIGGFITSLGASGSGEGLGKTYTLGPLPDYIEWAWMDVLCVLVYWLPGDPQPIGVDTIGEGLELFIVLDKPKFPQDALNFGKDIPWVSVLRISCDWARYAKEATEASQLLRERLWLAGTYNGGKQAYTYHRHLGTGGEFNLNDGEFFYLKSFLEDTRFPFGQCNDFADFLYCLMGSVGAKDTFSGESEITRVSGSKNMERGTGDYISQHPGNELYLHDTAFDTWPIAPAGYWRPFGAKPETQEWSYHQFVTYSGYVEQSWVWDGNLYFIRPRDWSSGDFMRYPPKYDDWPLAFFLTPREETAEENPPDYTDNLVRVYYLVHLYRCAEPTHAEFGEIVALSIEPIPLDWTSPYPWWGRSIIIKVTTYDVPYGVIPQP